MVSPKKLAKLEKKWQEIVVIRKKRSSVARTKRNMTGTDSPAARADRGQLVVRTADKKLCTIPSSCLSNGIIGELLKRSEQEHGMQYIDVPCASFFMEYIIRLIQQGAALDLVKTMLKSATTTTK